MVAPMARTSIDHPALPSQLGLDNNMQLYSNEILVDVHNSTRLAAY